MIEISHLQYKMNYVQPALKLLARIISWITKRVVRLFQNLTMPGLWS